MHRARAFLNTHWVAAAALVVLALAMRAMVPGGVMPTSENGRIVVALCSGSGPSTVTIDLGQAGGGDMSDDGPADAPCAFAGFAAPALSSADPVLLALSVAFAMLVVARAVAPLATEPLRLRPPLRGPPITF